MCGGRLAKKVREYVEYVRCLWRTATAENTSALIGCFILEKPHTNSPGIGYRMGRYAYNHQMLTSNGPTGVSIFQVGQGSPSLTVLPLYYCHARAFESSRQKFACSALPQQGKSSWLLLFFFLLLFPCWGRAEQANFWRELSNARSWR